MTATRFSSNLIEELINRLKRIHQNDEMTLEDADNLLTGALILNYQFFKLEGVEKSHNQIKDVLLKRIYDIVGEMA